MRRSVADLATVPARPTTGTARWVVLCSATPWAGGAHRQHALARELARSGEHRVMFVDPPSNRRVRDFRVTPVEDGIWQVSVPSVLPLGRQLPPVNRAGRRRTARLLRAWLDERPGDRLLWLDEDLAAPLVGRLGEAGVVYDATDLDWTFTRPWNRWHLRGSLRRAVAAADLVLASSSALPDRLPPSRTPPVVLPNACDPAHFRPEGPLHPGVAALPGPRIGYLGAIDERALDGRLVAAAARARPCWTFVLVGPSTPVGRAAVAGLPNVHVLDPVAHADAPAVVRAFDVATIPYRTGTLVDYVHPKKLYEYLAVGVPVVATALPALTGLTGLTEAGAPVRVAAGAERFVDALSAALRESLDPEARAARTAFATANSWAARGRTLHALLDAVGRP